MPRALKDATTIADPDGANALPYKLLVDSTGRLQWFEEGVSDDTMPPGQPISKKWRFFGGGMGETMDMGRGGYFFSKNAYHGDPFALKPRPTTGSVTLEGNTNPIEHFLEEKDSGGVAYLYALSADKSFKVKLSDQTLKETKSFSFTGFRFATGSYVGNGRDNRAITGVGFRPELMIIKGGAHMGVIKSSLDTFTKSWYGIYSDSILSFDEDGFTINDKGTVNSDGDTYYWQAWRAVGSDYLKIGSYTGDGNDDRSITGVGFQPDLVHLWRTTLGASYYVITKTSDMAGDASVRLAASENPVANRIQALGADGFQVGDDAEVNALDITYIYAAFKKLSGAFTTDFYTGNGLDDRKANQNLGFRPSYLFIRAGTSTGWRFGVHRSQSISGDESQYFKDTDNEANLIQALLDDDFELGDNDLVNKSGVTYYFAAWRTDATLGKPARWLGKSRVALGSHAGFATLEIVNDETANPGGDDTWVITSDIPCAHLERLGNKLARATKNKVSLCSADDITNLANWGAEYGGVGEVAIAPPDVEITDLVEWGNELAVCVTDGMYMFDRVATSKQQLPLLGGLKDADNGKNTLRVASFIFYPSADGYWRWRYGAHKRVDPDADRFYVAAKETSNEPLNLKHYGSAHCGDHVYHAAYDGTNYLILHEKLGEDGDLLHDCLLSTTSVIKAPYVDSDRRLWFGLGNNLAWIQLSQGGEADGGNFGEASLVTEIYLPQIILADDALVRLRMIKAIVRNMDVGGANTYKWELYASRDGAAFGAQIGDDIQGAAMDGANKRYWTAASNLTARRLRIKIVGTATAGYTPTTTAPEIIELEIFGETMPDDAVIIRAVIDLEDGKRSAKKIKSELKARENAGVVQVRDPIEDTVLNMIIYRVDLADVKQKGHEEPTAGMMIYMRYGDTS